MPSFADEDLVDLLSYQTVEEGEAEPVEPTLLHEPLVAAGVAAKALALHVRGHWSAAVFTFHRTHSSISLPPEASLKLPSTPSPP